MICERPSTIRFMCLLQKRLKNVTHDCVMGCDLPLDIVYCKILPLCDIDTRLAFKVPPKKLVVPTIRLSNDRRTFVRIVNSHMQMQKYMCTWHHVLHDCMQRFGIDMAEKDYWFCLLVLFPQLKISHGSKWRDIAQQMIMNDEVLDAVHVGYEPDISVYTSFRHAVV